MCLPNIKVQSFNCKLLLLFYFIFIFRMIIKLYYDTQKFKMYLYTYKRYVNILQPQAGQPLFFYLICIKHYLQPIKLYSTYVNYENEL